MNQTWLFVVHWNRPDECARTLRALTAQTPLRTLVIDNGSETLAKLRTQLAEGVEILSLPENRGWGPALNVALRDWMKRDDSALAFISAHDAQPSENCLPRLLAAMEVDPKIAIACPQYRDGSVPILSRLHGVAQRMAAPVPVDDAQEIDVPHSTLMLLRRAALEQIGFFDERYFAYGDEHELGARARRSGWKIALVGGALVDNPETSTPADWRDYLFARNSILLVRDHFGVFSALARATIIFLNSFRSTGHSGRAIRHGVRDYFRRNFGRPPISQ